MNFFQTTIEHLGRIITGKTPKTKEKTFWDGNIPFVTPQDLQHGKHILSTERKITNEGASSVKGAILPSKAICVSCIGNLGYVSQTCEKSVTNQQINSIIVNEQNDADFIYYLLKNMWSVFKNLEGQSTTLSILNKTLFSKIEVTIPSLEEQQRISYILNTLDEKIEQNAQINRNLEQQAQAIFKSWFVDFEPFQDGRFVDSELGPIPDGWRLTEMGDVTTEKRAKVGKQILKVFSAVNTGELKLSEDYFTKQVFSKDIGKYIVVEPLSFAYNPARINIGSIGINDMGYAGCVSPVYVVFSAEIGYQHFINFLIKRPFFKEELKTRSSGSVRQSLSHRDFGLIKTIYPPRNIIEQFNKVYEPILGGIKHNLAENTKLITLRDTLLPKLMSGEIDVSEVDV